MSDEEHTCDENCAPPGYPLDGHDIVGILIGCVGAVISNFGTCANLLANEFYASSKYRRVRKEQARQRAEVGFDLERLVEGDQ